MYHIFLVLKFTTKVGTKRGLNSVKAKYREIRVDYSIYYLIFTHKNKYALPELPYFTWQNSGVEYEHSCFVTFVKNY